MIPPGLLPPDEILRKSSLQSMAGHRKALQDIAGHCKEVLQNSKGSLKIKENLVAGHCKALQGNPMQSKRNPKGNPLDLQKSIIISGTS